MFLPAHIIAPDYSAFDNGALHALLTLQLAVPLAALGLALGRLPWRPAVVCGLLILAGLCIAAFGWPTSAMPVATYATPVAFLATGLALISAGTRYAGWIAPVAAIDAGAHAGLLGRNESPGTWFALGTTVGGAEVVIFPALLAARYWRPWMTIPARIVASWLLAIGFMFFGLALRPLPPGATVAPETETTAQVAACPGGHKHGVNGEFICLPPTTDPIKAATPNITKYDNAPPDVGSSAPKGGVQ